MTEILDVLTSPWSTLLYALLVFGFMPGFVLRLLVLIYPKGDLRRVDLMAELYVVPRIERPFYVAEQIETVLFEGVPERIKRIKLKSIKSEEGDDPLNGVDEASEDVDYFTPVTDPARDLVIKRFSMIRGQRASVQLSRAHVLLAEATKKGDLGLIQFYGTQI